METRRGDAARPLALKPPHTERRIQRRAAGWSTRRRFLPKRLGHAASSGAWVWSFELRPTNAHTRLISRNRFDTSAWRAKDWLGYPVMEPGSWLMERKMLLTIKQRAERLARTQTRA